MATATLERTREEAPALKAYGKMQGGVPEEQMNEEQRALQFNARIASNYRRLLDPENKRAEDFMDAPAAETFASPAARAQATLYPERYAAEAPAAAPAYEAPAAQVTFASPSFAQPAAPAYEAPAAPVYEAPAAPAYEAPVQEAAEAAYGETEADLMPTSTTIQYRDGLYREERREAAAPAKRSAMSARSKMLMIVYAVAVVVIIALIIVNTSALRRADTAIAAREAELASVVAQAQQLQEEIDYLTDPATIAERAAEELGMTVRG